MTGWMRVVLPWEVAATFAVVMLALGIPAAIQWYYSLRFGEFPGSGGAALLAFVPLGYAIYRVMAFHPALRRQYLEMLAGTPWQPGKPLPLGPVRLVAQDTVVLGVMFGIAWLLGGWLLMYIAMMFFALSYAVMLAWVMIATRQMLLFYFLVWAIGLMLYLVDTPWWIAVAVTTYIVAAPWLMRGFPWEFDNGSEHRQAPRGREVRVGWPFQALSPTFSNFPYAFLWTRHREILALVAGWLLYVLEHLGTFAINAQGERPTAFLLGRILIVAAAIIRLGAYHVWFWTPTAWHARILTGRPVIPRYDQVFIAPALALVMWGTLAYGLPAAGVPERFAAPVAFAAALYTLLVCPPSLLRWRLTGHHRILAMSLDSQGARR